MMDHVSAAKGTLKPLLLSIISLLYTVLLHYHSLQCRLCFRSALLQCFCTKPSIFPHPLLSGTASAPSMQGMCQSAVPGGALAAASLPQLPASPCPKDPYHPYYLVVTKLEKQKLKALNNPSPFLKEDQTHYHEALLLILHCVVHHIFKLATEFL